MDRRKLQGVQLSFFEELAYAVTCEGFRLVLCAMHVDLYRVIMNPRHVRYTGETFKEEACEHCKATREEIVQ